MEERAENRARAGRWLLTGVALAAVGWGILLRLVNVRDAFLFGDELHSLRNLSYGYAWLAGHYDSNGSGLALPLIQRGLADLVGLNHWSLRLPALLGSVGSILLALWLGRRLPPGTGWGAALLLAISPFHLFYGHFARIYGLLSLAGLLLLAICARLTASPAPRLRHYASLAALTALLPYLHVTATTFVLSLLGVTLALQAVSRDRRHRAFPVAASAGTGLAIAALLHLPAAESLRRFVAMKTTAEYQGHFGALDILVLIGGGRVGATLLLLAVLVGCGLAIRRKDPLSALLAGAVLGPSLALAIVRPYGDAYAYARYLMPSATVLALWVARTVALLAAADRPLQQRAAALVPGTLIALAAWPGTLIGQDGAYANTYLGMLSLPAFDLPYSNQAAFYRGLVGGPPVTLIEAPALLNRSRHLYRSSYLSHRQRTLLGFLPEEQSPWFPAGPYRSIGRDDLQAAGDADFLVLHRDVQAEARRYWQSVYAEPAAQIPALRAFMERHGSYNLPLARPTPELIAALQAKLGDPVYQDRDLAVFKLR